MASFYKWYNARLAARPLLTQCTSTGVLFGVGDGLAQVIAPDPELGGKYDYVRTLRMVFHGGVVFAPLVSQWYKLIGTKINVPGKPFTEALARMTADQLIWAPFGIASFYVSMGVLQGHSFETIKGELKAKYYPTMMGNYLVWPAVQIVNFRFMPLEYRLLFVNVVSIAWNTFLSWFSAVPAPEGIAVLEEAEHKFEELEHRAEAKILKKGE
ncbi:hypothetical protein BZA70DRAFT_284777 [Myxozyma melibiosi]|uniref:Protein SYM1 n=1 Tax=Myxozyma melibiosi TaxID=54550 RepID=A0ABR1EYM3_9ASCO